MSNLDRAIANQRASLKSRRRWLRQRKYELRRAAGSYCSKPTTLIGAFVAGTILGTLYPPTMRGKSSQTQTSGKGSFLRQSVNATLRLMAMNTVIRFLDHPMQHAGNERVESIAS